ncbi:cbb3-type cytochrome oxidase subunit 3 [Alkalimarinus sediminis]|uniref:Cbb3-type cytochrome c oxidase subunit 3 n=1 Tax=Alkalimarinus sediminis TaxID=1632866 RepID=A0A9E8KRI9_9ALTE|nr:cbb3-type cytochrome c oxidase subunit 3 [Alkalimarinus sediminis]UZW76430.1 cbb3-type cytochrome c oxidase subunit 3 [Alkalimarinus sediminis]
MDINTLRGISTILVMIAFISICLWAYSSKRKKNFDDAANLPFEDEEIAKRTLIDTEKRDHE